MICPVLSSRPEAGRSVKRTRLLQETRKMRSMEAYEGWHAGELTQVGAARLLGMCDRSFIRCLARYEAFDLEGLIDKRNEQICSSTCLPCECSRMRPPGSTLWKPTERPSKPVLPDARTNRSRAQPRVFCRHRGLCAPDVARGTLEGKASRRRTLSARESG
jgi:hypothetical protein